FIRKSVPKRSRAYTNGQCRTQKEVTLDASRGGAAMVIRRPRVKNEISFEARLLERAREARAAAHLLPPGRKREMLMRQARASEMAVKIDRWSSSPGLRPPE